MNTTTHELGRKVVSFLAGLALGSGVWIVADALRSCNG